MRRYYNYNKNLNGQTQIDMQGASQRITEANFKEIDNKQQEEFIQ